MGFRFIISVCYLQREPTDQDLQHMLKSKYSLRLDMDRKVIEHAALVTENTSPLDVSQEDMGPTPAKKFRGDESEDQYSEDMLLAEFSQEIEDKVKIV